MSEGHYSVFVDIVAVGALFPPGQMNSHFNIEVSGTPVSSPKITQQMLLIAMQGLETIAGLQINKILVKWKGHIQRDCRS